MLDFEFFGATERHFLPLTATEIDASVEPLPQHRLVPLRQAFDHARGAALGSRRGERIGVVGWLSTPKRRHRRPTSNRGRHPGENENDGG